MVRDFNPHHHAGGDVYIYKHWTHTTISIHTTTQVVTAPGGAGHGHPADFNPHHHAGGDTMTIENAPEATDFNPHHHAGGD